MKLRLRSRRSGNIVPFDSLVQEAVKVAKRLRALDSNPAESKLTSDAFLSECMALDESITDKSVAKLRKALERDPPTLRHSNASLRRMVSALRGPNLPRPPVAKHLDRSIRWLKPSCARKSPPANWSPRQRWNGARP